MELRISVTTTTAIKFGLQHNSRDRLKKVQSVAELLKPLPPPHNAKPEDPDTSQDQVHGCTRDSGAILKCQLFFLQVSFEMPTRLYLTVFFGLQVSFEMPTRLYLTFLGASGLI
jgi:hypothetical protein